ncbi:putative RNA-directed DNA polymerase [Tanacetum coccineum]
MDEVKAAVWDCCSSKSPGPDGLNFKFIKKYWDLIKFEFFNFVKYIESRGSLARGCNASFIVLIPKVMDPLDLSDYRPVSLIGCMYKVLSKLFASRLSQVIHKLISPNQTAFLKGRQILDGTLVANEIVNFAKNEGISLLHFKVDFEKAFDSVNWNFLMDIMAQMNFGPKWCRWIFSCLTFTSVSVLINGSPSKEFKMKRGLRQGDPLSPFLFLIVAEALQVMTLEACNKGIFKGLSLDDDGPNISLLQYADDALFFGEWLVENARNLVPNIARAINCSYGSLPFNYLGLTVGKRMNKVDAWNGVVGKLSERLATWKINLLSIGGRDGDSGGLEGARPPSTVADVPYEKMVPRINLRDQSLVKGMWAWRRQPRGRALDELSMLSSLISGLVLNMSRGDFWSWSLDESVELMGPPKGEYMRLAVDLNRLPTNSNLMQRGVQLPSSMCAFCCSDEETRDHCFFLYPIIKSIWTKIGIWWGSPSSFNPSPSDIFSGNNSFLKDKWVKKLFHVVCFTAIWHIWNWRNKICHTPSLDDMIVFRNEDIFSLIQRTSLLWASNRASNNRFSWKHWIHNPGELNIS